MDLYQIDDLCCDDNHPCESSRDNYRHYDNLSTLVLMLHEFDCVNYSFLSLITIHALFMLEGLYAS